MLKTKDDYEMDYYAVQNDLLAERNDRKITEAEELIKKLFADLTDDSGKPYYEHPIAVAAMVKGKEEKIVALLHDVLEDVPDRYSEGMMREQFGDAITESVKLLTHGSHLTKEEYLECIQKLADSRNLTAINVKIADLTHNTDISRLGAKSPEDLTPKQKARYEKYLEALKILKDANKKTWNRKYNDYIDYMMGDPADY